MILFLVTNILLLHHCICATSHYHHSNQPHLCCNFSSVHCWEMSLWVDYCQMRLMLCCVVVPLQEVSSCWSGCMFSSPVNHSTSHDDCAATQRLSADYVTVAAASKSGHRKCYVWPTVLLHLLPQMPTG